MVFGNTTFAAVVQQDQRKKKAGGMESYEPNPIVIGGVSLDTRAWETSPADDFGEASAIVEDYPGGAGWFLALGLAIAGKSPMIVYRTGCVQVGEPPSKLCSYAAGLGISLHGHDCTAPIDRFVSRLERGRLVSLLAQCPGPDVLLSEVEPLPAIGMLAVGYVMPTVWQDVLHVISRLRSNNNSVSFVGYAPSGSMGLHRDTYVWLQEVLGNVDALVVNQNELSWLADRMSVSPIGLAADISSRITLVITNGGKPIVALAGGEIASVPVAPIEDGDHDPIGAGDIFSAALFSHLQKGVPVAESVAISSVIASAACISSDPVEKMSRGASALDRYSYLRR